MAVAASSAAPDARAAPAGPGRVRLRLLSYNIHVGLETRHYGDYLTRGWQHVLPTRSRKANLDRIAELISEYDFVALQEADAGSLRSEHLNLIEHLAQRAGFAHWGHTVTRDLWPVARHSLGFLSRLPPASVQHQPLPSLLPGRRALTVRLGETAGGLTLLLTHLSLGNGSQRRQLDFLSAQVPPEGPVVLLGDLNAEPDSLRRHAGLARSRLWLPETSPATYPSWRPRRPLSHVLATPEVRIHSIGAVPHRLSDHLPLRAEVELIVPGSSPATVVHR